MAHRQATGVGPGDKAVVLAAVDLHLVLIEHVPQVAGHQTQRQVFALRAFEGVRRIRQVFLKLRTGGVNHAIEGLRANLVNAPPNRRQGRQRAAVAILLRAFLRLERRQRFFDAREVGKQVIEAAVFAVAHHDVFDVFLQGFIQFGRRQRSFNRFSGVVPLVTASTQRGTDTQYGNTAKEAATAGIGGLIGFGGGKVVSVFVVVHSNSFFAKLLQYISAGR